jgi:hypothetical protein
LRVLAVVPSPQVRKKDEDALLGAVGGETQINRRPCPVGAGR